MSDMKYNKFLNIKGDEETGDVQIEFCGDHIDLVGFVATLMSYANVEYNICPNEILANYYYGIFEEELIDEIEE